MSAGSRTHWMIRLGRDMMKKCDICGVDIKTQYATYIDGKTRNGSWATMCGACHMEHGVGFGLGKGQEFDIRTGKKVRG